MAQQPDRSLSHAVLAACCAVIVIFTCWLETVPRAVAAEDQVPVNQKKDEGKAKAPDKRVLIVSIDGLRPDLALLADTPHLHALIKNGAYSMWAQTIPIGKTLPSHTSMMTGVPMEKHGIIWNEDIPLRPRKYNYPHVPTLFGRAKEAGYTTALVAGKYKFEALAEPGTVDWVVLPAKPDTPGPDGKPISAGPTDADGMKAYDRKYDDAWIASEAVKLINAHKPQVMMVHFPRVDTAGHAKGWGSQEQLEAIARADEALGTVLDGLRNAKLLDDTLIILTADHGGFGKNHDGKDPRGLHIPWIAVGPGIRKGFDLTQNKQTINTMDTFATAAMYLNLKTEAAEEIEGKPVKDAFESLPRSAAVPSSGAK